MFRKKERKLYGKKMLKMAERQRKITQERHQLGQCLISLSGEVCRKFLVLKDQ